MKGVAMTYVSAEAKSYKAQVGWIAKAAGVRAPLSGRVAVSIQLYPAMPKDAKARMRKLGDCWDDGVRALDIDNTIKVTVDSLNGVVFVDDRQVWRITAERMEPDGDARAVVTITPIVLVSRQMEMMEVRE